MNWLQFRPFVQGVATLHEIQTQWTLVDLLDANEALDIQARADKLAMAGAK